MKLRDKIAFDILAHWGYYNIKVGDVDGRNFQATHEEHRNKRWYRPRDKTYKTNQSIAHAYRLADIAIEAFNRETK